MQCKLERLTLPRWQQCRQLLYPMHFPHALFRCGFPMQCKVERFNPTTLATVLAAAVSLGGREQRLGPAGICRMEVSWSSCGVSFRGFSS